MARALRIEFPGALYHVTARGNDRADIFVDDDDRWRFLSLLTELVGRLGWTCHAWCLMNNHYHLMIETAEANLGRGMRELNGVYTQRFNRAHDRVGHVFQGRYKALLVEREAYLLELARHVVLNPVRAGLVGAPADWRWSSYRRTAGVKARSCPDPDPVSADWILARFANEPPAAEKAYRRFIRAGIGQPVKFKQALRAGQVLGGAGFLAELRNRLGAGAPRTGCRCGRPSIEALRDAGQERGAWMTMAHDRHDYTLGEIGAAAGLHYSSVSKIIKKWRERGPSVESD